MYIPVAIKSEIIGAGTVICNNRSVFDSAESRPRNPGMANSPATAASEYNNPHFQRDLNKSACEPRKDNCFFSVVLFAFRPSSDGSITLLRFKVSFLG
jgi:hypothetical protein